MSRVETYLRAREMLVGFRDECHPACWVATTLAGYDRSKGDPLSDGVTAYDELSLFFRDEALDISISVNVAGENIESAISKIAQQYGEKRDAKVAACLSVVSSNLGTVKAVNDDSAPVEAAREGEPE